MSCFYILASMHDISQLEGMGMNDTFGLVAAHPFFLIKQ
jgi:hypothetical protein